MSDHEIVWVGCAATNMERRRKGQAPRAVVQHLMTGTLAGTDYWFKKPRPAAPSSAHFGIGPDGEIHQYVLVEDTAYSNGILVQPNLAAVPWLADAPWPAKITANHFTVSIEWAGNHVWKNDEIGGEVLEWWQPTEVQYQAGLWLTNKICSEQRIGIDRASITRHSDYNSSMKPGGKGWCPGLGFPMPRLLDDLKALSSPPAPPQTPYEVHGPPTISLAEFTSWLTLHGSPAIVERPASEYYGACVKAGIDPNFALAQFWHESQCGTDGIAKVTKSWGNLRNSRGHANGSVPGPFAKYDSWLMGLYDWITLWLTPPYQGLDMKTALTIYAPASDSNDPISYHTSIQLFMAARAQASKSG
jgi:N-acetyl-anhydromuramyl-L-alanine amidase AmpD